MESLKQNPESKRWVAVAKSSAIDAGKAIEVVVDVDCEHQVIAIFRSENFRGENQLFAIDGMCAHQGGPIAEGQVHAGCVTCPWHGWQYDLATGVEVIHHKPLQRVFEVRERDGDVEILVS